MGIVNGSLVMEAVGVRHIVAEFSFDDFEYGVTFVGFYAQYLSEILRNLIGHKVPVHAEVDPVALAELDEYNATIVVKLPDVDWIARLWPVMVHLSSTMSDAVESEDMGLVVWATYEDMGALS